MNTTQPNGRQPRRDRLIREHIHDPYKLRQKLPEPTVCPQCNAVFRGGRWQWADSWSLDSHRELCQACQRAKDNYPAGLVTLTGGFVRAHREEVLQLARNREAEENQLHPLCRIMGIEERPDAIHIKTTDIHLPRRIGHALRDAYKGELDIAYDEAGYSAKVHWARQS
jgi:NMD protein affecting ribosome stability and mRNA decay